jgi:hypothetical protein
MIVTAAKVTSVKSQRVATSGRPSSIAAAPCTTVPGAPLQALVIHEPGIR